MGLLKLYYFPSLAPFLEVFAVFGYSAPTGVERGLDMTFTFSIY
jgi:hypothetical protein